MEDQNVSVCLALKATHRKNLVALRKVLAIHLLVAPTLNVQSQMELPSARALVDTLKAQTLFEDVLSL